MRQTSAIAHSQAAIVSWWKIMKNDKKWWKMMKNDEKWWESELKVPYYPYFQTIIFSDAMILWMVAEEILHDQTDGWNPINPINNGINHLYTWLCQLYSTVCLVCMLLADLICNLFNPNLKEVRIMEGTWRYSSFLRIILYDQKNHKTTTTKFDIDPENSWCLIFVLMNVAFQPLLHGQGLC